MKVLIIKTSSMGDIIQTLPALTDATRSIKNIRFDWVVDESLVEIPKLHPSVDRIIPVSLERWKKSPVQALKNGEWERVKQCLSQYYDAVIDAEGVFKSAFLCRYANGDSFGLDWSSARHSLATVFYNNRCSVDQKTHVESIRQLFAKSLGYSMPKTVSEFGLNKQRFSTKKLFSEPYVVFCHGSRQPLKSWSDAYWHQLAVYANESQFKVIFPCSNEQERKRAYFIAHSLNIHVLPKMTVFAIVNVIAKARAVVTIDEGLSHLTAALDTPSLAICDSKMKKILAEYQNQVLVNLDESPINEGRKGYDVNPNPKKVWDQLEKMLSNSQQSVALNY